MVINQKLGVLFPDDIEHLIFTKYFEDYLVFIEEKSEVFEWVSEFVPISKIVTYSKINNNSTNNIIDLLENTNINELLKKHKITCTTVWRMSDYLYDWSKRMDIKIICPNYSITSKLNDKILFDEYLIENNFPKPNSKIFNYLKKTELFNGKNVLQIPISSGADGTFFVSSINDINDLINQNKIDQQTDYLLREFVDGISYGITIFISKKSIVLSALRTQQFYGKINNMFAGIQWVKGSSLKKEFIDSINTIFFNIGKNLHNQGYLGYASIDFIEKENKISIIECNPRFGDSTAQLLLHKQLTSGVDTVELFVNDFFSEEKFTNPELIPFNSKSDYDGTSIEFKKIHKLKFNKNGIYDISNGIKFISSDITKFDDNKNNILYSNWFIKDLEDLDDAGTITTNYPLFKNQTELNLRGEKLLEN